MSDITFREITGTAGVIGEITLNRPKALNALTLQMCQEFYKKLSHWENDDAVKAVIVKGNSECAFCAGGDIRKLYEYRHADKSQLSLFFWHEYRLNLLIHHFKKPYFPFMHHITMGGGAGISINGNHRIAAENLCFAMPETKIGFYPDIGALHFLQQCMGQWGLYLALTGNTIDASIAKSLGLVTHIIPQEEFNVVEKAIINCEDFLKFDLKAFAIDTAKPELFQHEDVVNHCFSKSSVDDIVSALEKSDQWGKNTANILRQRSPSSLKITFAAYQKAQDMSFNDIMQMNFDLTQQFLREADFFEGVRSAIIDKDQDPKWQQVISDNELDQYFKYKGKALF